MAGAAVVPRGGAVPHSPFARKPVGAYFAEARADAALRRALGAVDVLVIGIGAIVGAGIFVLVGVAARQAGPAVLLSFLLAAVACAFAALCYAELAAALPASGSAYSYAYAALGEIVAWLVGWNLVLEYTLGASLVASGWSGYCRSVLAGVGLALPASLANNAWSAPGGVIDLPAVAIVVGLTVPVLIGIRESATFTRAMVALKISIVLVVTVVGAFHVRPANWQPFAPLGPFAVLHAAALVFLAYVGFDVASTTACEVRDPRRDLPVGILGSLLISALLYAGMVVVLTGMVPYDQIDAASPIDSAFQAAGLGAIGTIITAGALVGLTSVLVALLIGQPRIFFAMAHDGLLPPRAAAVHPRFQTPVVTTLVSGVVIALAAGLVPIEDLANMTSIGTLLAFAAVCSAVPILRWRAPDLSRGFRCPGSPAVPLLGTAICLALTLQLDPATWVRLVIWTAIGLAIYFGYGRQHSRLEGAPAGPGADET